MKAAHNSEPVSIGPEGPSAQLEQQLQRQRDALDMITIEPTGKEILDKLCRPVITQLRIK